MSDTVIKVENLSKKYIISHQRQERYTSLRDVIAGGANNLFRRFTKPFISNDSSFAYPTHEEFWALKDINFEIKQGDCVGIIGRNGAGKSTLLKLLSRITEPTTGKFTINGRVASLLEVGTGFHPELTGRENIFLNGAILGMSRIEIKKKFDEIVAFAEIEKFLDTPVKRYSSGMYVRLAFAVAAHLEPEVLIVDEVLAVGDAEFQRKCLGKMKDVSQEGRTVLFVSHNMAAVQRLCNEAILLETGKKIAEDNTEDVVRQYLTKNLNNSASVKFPEKPDKEEGQICAVRIFNDNGKLTNTLDIAEGLQIEIEYVIKRPLKNHRTTVALETPLGERIFNSTLTDFATEDVPANPGRYAARIKIPKRLLNTGEYMVTCSLDQHGVKVYDIYENVLKFSIEGYPWKINSKRPGILAGNFIWTVSQLAERKTVYE